MTLATHLSYCKDRLVQAWLGVVAMLLLLGLVMGPAAPQHFDSLGFALGRDFVNVWAGAKLIAEGKADTLTNWAAYQDYLHTEIHTDYEDQNWSYPPTLQTLILPFAYIPYTTGYFLWMALTILPLLMAVRGFGWGVGVLLVLVFSPAGLWNLFAGQFGFLTAGLLALGLQNRTARPWLAAVCFALLTIKPHVGVLIPFLLLCERNWRLILRTALLAGAWVLLSVLVFGVQGWVEYVTTVRSYQWDVLTNWEGFVLYLMPSGWMAGRLLGLDQSAIALLQILVSGVGLFLAVRAFRRPELSANRKAAILMVAGLVILPYFFYYDMVAYHLALLLFWRESECLTGIAGKTVKFLCWILPIWAFLGVFLGLQLTPAALLVLVWWMGRIPNSNSTHAA